MNEITTITQPVSHYVNKTVTAVKNGDINPLTLFVNFKKLEKIIKSVLDDNSVSESIRREYDKYGEKNLNIQGTSIQQSESGVQYDYSACGDPEIKRLIEEKEDLDKRIKDREKFLKNIPSSGQTLLNEETGEINTVYPPSRSSKTILKVTIKC